MELLKAILREGLLLQEGSSSEHEMGKAEVPVELEEKVSSALVHGMDVMSKSQRKRRRAKENRRARKEAELVLAEAVEVEASLLVTRDGGNGEEVEVKVDSPEKAEEVTVVGGSQKRQSQGEEEGSKRQRLGEQEEQQQGVSEVSYLAGSEWEVWGPVWQGRRKKAAQVIVGLAPAQLATYLPTYSSVRVMLLLNSFPGV